MAIANVRERLALHFDAEGSLESRVVANAYEVHLRMPYRAVDSAAASGAAAKPAAANGKTKPADRAGDGPAGFVVPQGKVSHG